MRAFQKQAAPNTPVTNSPGLSEREGQSPDPPASSSCCHRSSKSSWSVSFIPTLAGSRVRPAEHSQHGCSHLTNPSLILLPTNHLCREKLVLRARPVPRDIPNMPSQCPSQDVPGCGMAAARSQRWPSLQLQPSTQQSPAQSPGLDRHRERGKRWAGRTWRKIPDPLDWPRHHWTRASRDPLSSLDTLVLKAECWTSSQSLEGCFNPPFCN